MKTSKELVNLYYESVGHNSLLLLNIPPNREGLFSDTDIASIIGFRKILNETFENNLAKGKIPSSLTDKNLRTYLSLKVNQPLIIAFKKPLEIDRAMLQENIATGQRIKKALLEYWDGKEWKTLREFTTVGYKRLLRFDVTALQKVRITIVESRGTVQLSEMGFFKASGKE